MIGLLAVGATVAAVYATAHGPSINPDGVSYLRMAGRLPPIEHPAGHFPEGYPVVLAALQRLGFNSVGSGRWLDVGLIAVNVALVGMVARRMAGPRWAVVVALAFVTSSTLLPLSASVNSEPLFITLLLAWVLLVDSQQPTVVAAAGVVAAMSSFVRFAGFAVVVAGVIVLWSQRERVRAFVIGAGVPLLMWAAVRIVYGGSDVRDFTWHPPARQKVLDGIGSLQAWATGHPGAPLAGLLVVTGALVLLWRARDLRSGQAIAVAAGCYLALLTVTVLFFDAQTPLDLRLFAPLLVLVLLSVPALSTLPAPRVLAVGVVGMIALNGWATWGLLDPFDNGMFAFADRPTVSAARELDGAIASNAAGALWLLTGKEVRWIPKVTDPYTEKSTHDFDAAISRLRDELRNGGHLVWLDVYDYRTYLPTEDQTARALGAVLVERFPDGAIYTVNPAGA